MSDREFVLATIFVVAMIVLVVFVGILVWRMVTNRPENGVMFRMTLLERCATIINLVLLRLGREPSGPERVALEAMAGDAARTAVDIVVPPAPRQPAAVAQPAAAQPPAAGAGGQHHVVIDVNIRVDAGQGVNVNPHP